MIKEFRGKVGPIEGSYKKETQSPIVINSCQHIVVLKERRIHSDRLIMVHGGIDGSNRISIREIEREDDP